MCILVVFYWLLCQTPHRSNGIFFNTTKWTQCELIPHITRRPLQLLQQLFSGFKWSTLPPRDSILLCKSLWKNNKPFCLVISFISVHRIKVILEQPERFMHKMWNFFKQWIMQSHFWRTHFQIINSEVKTNMMAPALNISIQSIYCSKFNVLTLDFKLQNCLTHQNIQNYTWLQVIIFSFLVSHSAAFVSPY